jgi:hypothetical protein
VAKSKAKKSDSGLDRKLEAAFKKHLDGAKEGASSSGFDEFDDGRYKAKLTKAELGKSQAGRRQVIMAWQFLSGEYKKKIKYAYSGVETENNLKFLLIDLQRLGYDTDAIESLDDLKGILKELTKDQPTAKIALKTKGDFQNVIIIPGDGSDDEEDGEDDEDDDESEEDDDEEPKKKSKSKTKSKDEDDDEDEDDDSDDEDEDDEDEKPKKKSAKKASSDDDEDEEEDEDDSDDEDEDEDDEDDKKSSKKKSSKKKADDDDDDEDEDEDSDDDEDEDSEDVELSVGSDVTYKYKGKKVKGTVLDIFPKTNEVRVQTDDKKRKISFDDIVEVETPAEPKSKKKKTKK